MAPPTEIAVLLIPDTRDAFFSTSLGIISALGVDTETWESGDPSRSTLYANSVQLEHFESMHVSAIKGGFIDTAEGDWLDWHAESFRNTPRRQATFATCTGRFTNNSGETHEFELGDTVGKNDGTATYRITDLPFGSTLAAANGSTLDVEITCDIAGTEGNAGVNDIETIITPARANVSFTNLTTASATNRELDPSLRDRARGALKALSPNGPKGAYDYIVTTPEYNGGASVTRSRTVGNSPVGYVQVYVAGDSGAVAAGDVTLCQAAIERYCEPICIQGEVFNTSNLTQAVTYQLWVYDSINLTEAEIEELIEDALAEAIPTVHLGGDIIPPAETGKLYKGFIESTIWRTVHPHGFRVVVTTPAADVDMTLAQVAVLGAVTATVNIIEAP